MFALKMEEENNLDMTLRDAMLDYVELHILYILSHKRELVSSFSVNMVWFLLLFREYDDFLRLKPCFVMVLPIL